MKQTVSAYVIQFSDTNGMSGIAGKRTRNSAWNRYNWAAEVELTREEARLVARSSVLERKVRKLVNKLERGAGEGLLQAPWRTANEG